jgi:hypothetical protein
MTYEGCSVVVESLVDYEDLPMSQSLQTLNDRVFLPGRYTFQTCRFEIDILARRKGRGMQMQYPKTKTLDILFVRELASRLPSNSPLIVSCLTPGLCRSRLRRSFPWPLSWIYVVVIDSIIAWSTERGSRQFIFAALGRGKREDELKELGDRRTQRLHHFG